MVALPSRILLTFAAAALFITSACRKELPTGTDDAGLVNNDDCPSLAGNIANLPLLEAGQQEKLLAFFTPAEIADLQGNSCLAKVITPDENEATDRSSGLKYHFWTPGSQIRVRFLNGSAGLQQKVFSYAKEWESFADVSFRLVTSGDSEVRILFAQDGHWSYIGTDNRQIDACAETMSLQLSDNTQGSEIRRVVLHEFGHVLGLQHEHQQPLASIPWNTTAVYNYYAQQDWTREEVDEQVLNKNSAESSEFTNFDDKSIMQYPVPASLTTNGYSIGWNTQLSATDKSFIGLMYSNNRMKIRHAASGYNASITFQLAGIYHTVKYGETLSVPALTGTNSLSIWEQPSGTWVWDNGYVPAYGRNYKIVRIGSGKDLKLVEE